MEDFWGITEELFISTYAMFRFLKILKALKRELRSLSKKNLGDLLKMTKEAYDELRECQVRTLINPTQDVMGL